MSRGFSCFDSAARRGTARPGRKPSALSLLLCLALCCLALAFGRVPAHAAPGPFLNPFNGHWYEAVAVPAGINFANARTAAGVRTHLGQQGYLATITSSEEYAWVVSTFPDAVSNWYWLGAFQPPGSAEPGSGWEWVTGEPWTFDAWQRPQPDNGNGNEHSLQFMPGGRWNDQNGNLGYAGYVVEYGSQPPARAPLTFTPPVSYQLPPNAIMVTNGHYDEDAFLDLAVNAQGFVYILYGRGDGSFDVPLPYAAGGSLAGAPWRGVQAADVNADNLTDIVTAKGSGVVVRLNLGSRSFGPERFTPRAVRPVFSGSPISMATGSWTSPVPTPTRVAA
jgi:hypothetical protein